MTVSTQGIYLGDPAVNIAGAVTWGPGGFSGGYHGDSSFYVSNYGIKGQKQWWSGFGGVLPQDNVSAYSYTQFGQDGHDSAWDHARRNEPGGFVYWTPNNSVCWRRPPTWPSDCASAPDGDNPVTDIGHATGSFNILDYGTTTDACAWEADGDPGFFSASFFTVTSWTHVAEIDLMALIHHSPWSLDADPLKGAIDAIRDPDISARREVNNVRVKCTASVTQFNEIGTPTITWRLIAALTSTPAVGPFLEFEGPVVDYWTTDHWNRMWEYGDPASMPGTVLGSVTTAAGTTGWIDVDQAAVDAALSAQYDRLEALQAAYPDGHYSTGDSNLILGPTFFVVGLLDAHMTATAPYKDTSASGRHFYGYDGGCNVDVEATVEGATGHYVMYDQPAAVPGTACPTFKMVTATTSDLLLTGGISDFGFKTLALETSLTGPVAVASRGWDPQADEGSTSTQLIGHPYKWSPQHIAGWPHIAYAGGYHDYRTYEQETAGALEVTGYVSNTYGHTGVVTGNGAYWVHHNSGTDWDVWRTSATELEGEFVGTFSVGFSTFYGNDYDAHPGPGNSVIVYSYDNVFLHMQISDTGITGNYIGMPTWAGSTWGSFAEDYLHRITLEPNSNRIWWVAYRQDDDEVFGPGYNYYLVAFYDFATAEWSNILEMLGDYNWLTYMGDDWGAVGFAADGAYLTGTRTPNVVLPGDPDPEDDFHYIAAVLGEHFVRGITRVGLTISWAGEHRTLMYRDNEWYGNLHLRWGADPVSGGLYTNIPVDMRTTYVGYDVELWAAQISSLTGSGSQEMPTLLISDLDQDFQELSWALCALKWLRLNQRNDHLGNRFRKTSSRLDNRGTGNSSSVQEGLRLQTRNGKGYS